MIWCLAGFGVWLGRNTEEVRGGPGGDVVAEQSSSGFSLQVKNQYKTVSFE